MPGGCVGMQLELVDALGTIDDILLVVLHVELVHVVDEESPTS